MEAKTIIKKMSEEEANWFRQNSIDIARRDYNSDMDAAWEKGARQKAVETARNLLAMNLGTPEQIAQAIGLTLAQVIKLQKELAAPAN